MAETSKASGTVRALRGLRTVGSAHDGQVVVLEFELEGGGSETFAIHPSRVGAMVASLQVGSELAARDRAAARAAGAGVAETSTLLDILRINAASAPGADHLALRVVLGEGANLDFRIPLAVVPSLQQRIADALALARQVPPAP